jgi:hypothetical protein
LLVSGGLLRYGMLTDRDGKSNSASAALSIRPLDSLQRAKRARPVFSL